jgi:hypothetical protein
MVSVDPDDLLGHQPNGPNTVKEESSAGAVTDK